MSRLALGGEAVGVLGFADELYGLRHGLVADRVHRQRPPGPVGVEDPGAQHLGVVLEVTGRV